MKFNPPHTSANRLAARGFTLVEMMVSAATSALLIAAVACLGVFTSRSFFIMGNYVDLDAQSRNAVDVLGRQIRDSSALLQFSTSSPQYLELTNNISGSVNYISYYPANGTLMMTNIQAGTTTVQMLLTNCDLWNFTLYDRAPDITDLTFYSATNSLGNLSASACKVINMSWKCSRSLLGSKFNTESVQTAEIILRNKVK